MDSYDVVIVGAGSSGGALAGRLTQTSGKRVLVLEGGPIYNSAADMPSALLEPGTMAAGAPGHPNNWGYLVEMRPGLKFPFPRGKGLGGSSSINGCYFIRGTRDDFGKWSDVGNDEWAYDKVLPVFKRMESDLDIANEYHGADGPITVRREPGDRAPEATDAFVDSCRSLGFADDPDKNAPSAGGVGPVPMNIKDGQRSGTALGYLVPAMGRPNFDIVGNAIVQRVIFEGRKAVGVEARVDGVPRTFRGDEIVISAGALRTPQILMVSGIGPADQLAKLGIAVVQDLPGVGQNLTDHPAVSASWEAKVPLPKTPDSGPLTTALHWRAEGTQMEVVPFVAKMGDMLGMSDVLERPVKALGAMRGTSVKAVTRQALMLRYAMLGIAIFQAESRGSVTLQSANPRETPVINFNLLSEETDRVRLREAVRVAYEVFQEPAFRKVGGTIVGLSPSDLKDNAALDKWVAEKIGAGHPSCSCKMGPASDPTAVVDQYLRVHGVGGLRVADTSVFPTIPSRGPNATAIMVGEHLADFLA